MARVGTVSGFSVSMGSWVAARCIVMCPALPQRYWAGTRYGWLEECPEFCRVVVGVHAAAVSSGSSASCFARVWSVLLRVCLGVFR
eukprot:7630454-Alexandrium_andersonii.AAC.1